MNNFRRQPMFLLNGEWGSGKSEFVSRELEGKLTENTDYKNVVYVRLGDVSSKDEFLAKLFSKCNDANSSTKSFSVQCKESVPGKLFLSLSKKAKDATDILAENFIKSIIGEQKNTCFIIDDLERIDNKELKKSILYYFQNLLEENPDNNNAVLVVSFSEKLADTEVLEKCFSKTIEFWQSAENIVKILTDTFSDHLYSELQPILMDAIDTLNFKNIRMLEDCIEKYIEVADRIDALDSINRHESKAIILKSILSLYYAEKILGFSESDINNYLVKDKEDISGKLLDRILKSINPDVMNALLSFCCKKTGQRDFSVADMKLPIIRTNLDLILNKQIQEIENNLFDEGIIELYETLFGNQVVEFSLWYRCAIKYAWLCNNDYIPTSSEDRFNKLTSSLNSKIFSIEDDEFKLDFKLEKDEINIPLDFLKKSKSKYRALKDNNNRSIISYGESNLNTFLELECFCKSHNLDMLTFPLRSFPKEFKKSIQLWTSKEIWKYDKFIFSKMKSKNLSQKEKSCLTELSLMEINTSNSQVKGSLSVMISMIKENI